MRYAVYLSDDTSSWIDSLWNSEVEADTRAEQLSVSVTSLAVMINGSNIPPIDCPIDRFGNVICVDLYKTEG